MERPVVAPLLETERLILRAHRKEDLEPSLAMWCEPEGYHFISGTPATREEIWRGIMRHTGQWQMLGFGSWVVVEKHSGQFFGEMGFLDCKRDIVPSMDSTPEAGWALSGVHQGYGYAHEAMARIVKWGDENLLATKTACIIDPANTRSLGLAAKLGFLAVTEITYRDNLEILHHRDKR